MGLGDGGSAPGEQGWLAGGRLADGWALAWVCSVGGWVVAAPHSGSVSRQPYCRGDDDEEEEDDDDEADNTRC